ncbi:unnamed protein product [Trifolium pratense]|uniref:Uncharacterized protein n=1 Tax=Trifolium pratense TaxID=57577 RepID=A0ACB0LBA6_TRIPR|nr:unnamed protein product [Trifolium pratense]
MFSEFLADLNAEFTSENQGMSADVITKAFLATEEEFLAGKEAIAAQTTTSFGWILLLAVQLSYEHNDSLESVREELRSLHPDDP